MKLAASRRLALIINTILLGSLAGGLTGCTVSRDAERDAAATSEPAAEAPARSDTAVPVTPTAAAVDKAERRAEPQPAAAPVSSIPEKNKRAQALEKSAGAVAGSSALYMGPSVATRLALSDPGVVPIYSSPTDNEKYQHQSDNPVHLAGEQPFSTFSIDVDTGAYTNVRRFLNAGQLPPQDAVRVEEMINYFDYQYSPPANRSTPFRVSTELAAVPWNPDALLLRIGIKGFEVSAEQRPPANLVFLIDVSGSMQSADKMPLLKNSLRLLTDQLSARDRVSMVVYADSSGVVLEPTPGDQKAKIKAAIDQLEAGGSTNGAAGIQRAYQLAHQAQIAQGINRVILATDGDFNVGIVDFEALIDMAEQQRTSGVALTTLGFGTGNYNDELLERLADAGNGNYAYVDSLTEARKVLVSELSATLFTIAKDVKIQVEFNPAEVLQYRLIGYENRALAREDFNNDKVDAGEIGAGHRVTALYEIVKVGGKGLIDPSRYGSTAAPRRALADNGELAHLRLRYKQPDADDSKLLEFPIMASSVVPVRQTSADFRFAASVAAFGQILRGGKYTGRFGYDDVTALAKDALGADSEGYRHEFMSLVKLAKVLTPAPQQLSEERAGEGR